MHHTQRVLKLLAIGLLTAGLGACSGKEEANQMTKFANQMCECKTIECVTKLFPEVEKFSAANAGKEVSADQADKYNNEMGRLEKCATKIQADAEKAEKK